MPNIGPRPLSNATPWKFVLYISGESPAGQQAENTLRRLCDHYLSDRFSIEVVNIQKRTEAVPPDVLVLPTVVRVSPRPERRVIGDLSDREAAIRGLGLETDT